MTKRSNNNPGPSIQKTKQLGQQGELYARRYLEQKGYQHIASNWRLGRYGELDLIMFEPTARLVIWVEVKTRKRQGWDDSLASVNAAKCEKLAFLAEGFLSQHPEWQSFDSRFDVVAIQWQTASGVPAVCHSENVLQQDVVF